MKPPDTPSVLILRIALLIAMIAAGSWGIITGYPWQGITPNQQFVIGVSRALFGALLTFRLYRSWEGIPLMLGWRQTPALRKSFVVWMLVTTCITLGIATPIMLALHWGFQLAIQRRSRIYSVEDVLFRLVGFCFLFLQSHLAFSLDAKIGLNYGLTTPSPAGVNFFIWVFGAVIFSTGFEKIWSKIWQQGLGFYYFVSMPHLVNPRFNWLKKHYRLCWILSWLTIFFELAFFPSIFSAHARWILYPIMTGFALSLFTVVDISFIGQITLLATGSIFALDVAGGDFLAKETLYPTVSQNAPLPLLGILVFLYSCGIVAILGFSKVRTGFIGRVMEYTFHARPFVVFLEIHYFGLYTYRVMGETKNERRSLMDVFREDGSPGSLQRWRPRTFQGAMYRVTDYCIATLNENSTRASWAGRTVEDLGFAAMEMQSPAARRDISRVTLEVRVLNPSEHYQQDTSDWLSPTWQEIGHYDFDNGVVSFTQHGDVPKYLKTFRWPVAWS